jgi:hypothetical protein
MKNLAIISAACLLAGTVSAATFTVDSTADDGSSGTLRWAIDQHNANPASPNEILFDSTLAGSTISLDLPGNGELAEIIAGTLSIDGSDAAGVVVDAGSNGRVFKVSGAVDTFTLRAFEVRNGFGQRGGGCLRAIGTSANINVEEMIFRGCEIESGAFDALGGAITAEFASDSGILSISESEFFDNRVFGDSNAVLGGAVYVENGGDLSISDTRFEGNSTDDAGPAFAGGGAVYVRDTALTIVRSEFVGNDATTGFGGAVAYLGIEPATARIRTSFFAANRSDGVGSAFWQGAVLSGEQPVIFMTNNTLVDNRTANSTGGAVFFRDAEATLRNNTFNANRNTRPGGGGTHLAYRSNGVTLSAVANNAFGPADDGPACATVSNATPVTPLTATYNLLPDNSCQFAGTGDIVDADAGFLPAGDYGGPTPTQPPLLGNPAVDGGNPAAPDNLDAATCRETDARGTARPGDGDDDGTSRCDIGAFEWTQLAEDEMIFMDRFEETP